ncbi:MAG: alanine--glyoxylate aminotransferase family protein [Chloroflexi bacterium]|nr:alanine--glyoxylate aminotransferase family protein [Chloroflexota bacterium]
MLRALTTPPIGQFDPAFTAIMDDVVSLARATFVTSSPHCFGISTLASGGLEAVLNSLIDHPETPVAVGGDPRWRTQTADLVRRLGGTPQSLDEVGRIRADLVVVPYGLTVLDLRALATTSHQHEAALVVDATLGLGVSELRVDDWAIDVCVAGVEYGIGAPAGMSLVTYSAAVDDRLQQRATPPTVSYLDLIQLQAYWSPERLNHHTAPTSLVYGLHEALRLLQLEGLEARWQRHAEVGQRLRTGLLALGLACDGALPYSIVHLPATLDEPRARTELRERFGISVTRPEPGVWRLGLLGADARPEVAEHVLAAVEKVLAA